MIRDGDHSWEYGVLAGLCLVGSEEGRRSLCMYEYECIIAGADSLGSASL